METLIGKKVIVRANVAGVHAGEVAAIDLATQTITLKNEGLEISEMTDKAWESIQNYE